MRIETVERQLYQFTELDTRAKERAREWWRELENQEFQVDYDDFENVAAILGIEFAQRPIKTLGGQTRYEPAIYWSGFSSQGDGACFEGRYAYAAQCRKKIREYAPQDATLHKITDELFEVQRKNFYKVSARCTHSGRYYHSGCMFVAAFRDGDDAPSDVADSLTTTLRAFADWVYRQLEQEYVYRMSDEQIDDAIQANEYEFLADGTRA